MNAAQRANALRAALLQIVEDMNKLLADENIRVEWAVGTGPDGRVRLDKFVALQPLKLDQ